MPSVSKGPISKRTYSQIFLCKCPKSKRMGKVIPHKYTGMVLRAHGVLLSAEDARFTNIRSQSRTHCGAVDMNKKLLLVLLRLKRFRIRHLCARAASLASSGRRRVRTAVCKVPKYRQIIFLRPAWVPLKAFEGLFKITNKIYASLSRCSGNKFLD